MNRPGTQQRPLRVAVIGSGPAGFFVAEQLQNFGGVEVTIDMFERLPTPFGLVRFGVAPDHPKIKAVTRKFEIVASRPGFRFLGNVRFGIDIGLDDLRRHYDQVCFATGAQSDRRLGIPGEDLARSHAATEFVAWYNGHPDYRDLQFDLTVENAAVIGIGNVALDVARILGRTPEELERTDIADHALEALRVSRVREIMLLGRRGPAQAKFTNPELRELGEMSGADFVVSPEQAEPDAESTVELERAGDRERFRRIEILRQFAARARSEKPRILTLRFLVSPTELHGDDRGRVRGMRLVRNRLERSADGDARAVPTDATEDLDVGLVFRSVGYRGVEIPGVPFDASRGLVPNASGRVLETVDGQPVNGLYVSGWIKRGPFGVVGTNKPDAVESVRSMMEDLGGGRILRPDEADPSSVLRRIRDRGIEVVSYQDWKRLDGFEVARGAERGRPRVKASSVDEMLRIIRRPD